MLFVSPWLIWQQGLNHSTLIWFIYRFLYLSSRFVRLFQDFTAFRHLFFPPQHSDFMYKASHLHQHDFHSIFSPFLSHSTSKPLYLQQQIFTAFCIIFLHSTDQHLKHQILRVFGVLFTHSACFSAPHTFNNKISRSSTLTNRFQSCPVWYQFCISPHSSPAEVKEKKTSYPIHVERNTKVIKGTKFLSVQVKRLWNSSIRCSLYVWL